MKATKPSFPTSFSCSQTASALVLAVASAVYGQQSPGTPAPASASVPAAKPPASAGLINDFLREQSPSFKSWDIGVQLRGRFEVKENGGNDGRYASEDFVENLPANRFNDNSYLWLREKVHIGYTPCDWLNVFVQGRDSSSSGDKRNPNPGADQFDLHQAYLGLGNPKEFPLTLKVGRQEMLYGDERIIGIGDWGNLGRSFDAAKLRFEHESTWVDGFVGRVVMPDNHNFNMPNDYDFLSGVYASTRSIVSFQESQFYFIAHNVNASSAVVDPGWIGSPSRVQDTYTIGIRAKSLPGKLNDWDYTGEFASQFGSVNNGVQRLDQQAFYLATSGGYTFKDTTWQPRAGLGYDYATGDEDPTDDDNQTFEPLFPTNHKIFGYMDMIGPRNIHNPRLNLSVKPHKKLSVTLDYHLFWLADTSDFFYPESGSGRNRNGYGRNPGYSSFVGQEIDLDFTFAFKPWAILRTGYGHFFTGDYIDQSLAAGGVGSTDADWLYVQTTLSF